MKKIMIVILVALLGIVSLGASPKYTGFWCTKGSNVEKNGIFSWNYLIGEADAALLTKHQITEVYQYIRSSYTDEAVADYLKLMKKYNIDVYILDGEPQWCDKNHRDEMRDVLDRMDHYNSLVPKNAGIKGVVFDVEPYLLDGWKESGDQMIRWLRKNVEALKKERDVTIYVCIPYFYDTHGYSDQLEKLVMAADGIMVMNYYRQEEISHIATESAYAAKYNTRLINLYELKPHGDTSSEDRISYYYEGLDKTLESIERIRLAYPDIKIDMGYHDIKYFKELVNR